MKIKLWGVRGSIPSPLNSTQIEKKIISACEKYKEFLQSKIVKRLSKKETFHHPEIEKIITKIFSAKNLAPANFVSHLPQMNRGTYGGNTACVEVRCGKQLIIIDAGTGIRNLGLSLLSSEFGKGKGQATILLSHTHFDHIDGWPFFVPAYIPGNYFDIYGPKHSVEEDKDLKTVFEEHMNFSYFPVFLRHMGATVEFHDIGKGTFYIDKVKVSTQPLQHACQVLGYRLEYKGKVFVYESDSEPYYYPLGNGMVDESITFIIEESNKGVIELAKNADVLIYDAQYTPEEYDPGAYGLRGMGKKGWGHSTYEHAIDRAVKAGAKMLIMFHHDPQHDDEFVQNMLKQAKEYAHKVQYKGVIEAAYEGMTVEL